ncbi:hypothetical protein [Deinococcus aerophilus]|uniref:Uncharacterized protein n=1 Tax=Deinococcus aerophilus TaxID=522488 RepID=A0ABQ2GKT5_9DEIO|nr:hypothetical protein [Deinococcus aerophilus]GGL99335.1 hypothetical protein GCM10010841_04890 [Deinococcus aerophilus]
MPRLTPFPASTTALPDLHDAATLAAAEAVLAQLSGRAPLRIESVSLADGPAVRYALAPDLQAMRANRGLMEDVVMTALAAPMAAGMLGLPPVAPGRDARALLDAALTEPEEREAVDAYLTVLSARTRTSLRRAWAEIGVVAAGLREHGVLDLQDVQHRMACAQGIRGTLLN